MVWFGVCWVRIEDNQQVIVMKNCRAYLAAINAVSQYFGATPDHRSDTDDVTIRLLHWTISEGVKLSGYSDQSRDIEEESLECTGP
jgi:hypothetical protein